MVQRNMMLSVLRRAYPNAMVTLVAGERLADQFADLFPDAHWATDILRLPGSLRYRPGPLAPVHGRADRPRVPAVPGGPRDTRAARRARPRRGHRCPARVPQRWRRDPDLTEPIRLRPPVLGFPDLYEYASALAAALRIKPAAAPSEAVPPLPALAGGPAGAAHRGPAIAIHAVGQLHWNRRWPLARFGVLGVRLVRAVRRRACACSARSARRTELTLLREGVLAGVPAAAQVRIGLDASLNRTANLLGRRGSADGQRLRPAARRGRGRHADRGRSYGPTGTELLWARVYPWHRGVSLHYPARGSCTRWTRWPAGCASTPAWLPTRVRTVPIRGA